MPRQLDLQDRIQQVSLSLKTDTPEQQKALVEL